LQVRNQTLQVFAIVVIAIVGVRGGNHVGNTIRRGHATHLDAGLPGLGTIVDFWKDVGVDIDHVVAIPASPSVPLA
jgi:hypothetical protein